jgi:PEP-CTERM motif
VSSKTLRMFMCAAAAAALGTFGTATQATLYGGGFDPPTATGHFTGEFLLDITDSCFSEGPCQVDLISLTITSSTTFGSGWFSGFQGNIASSASLDGGLHFNSVEIPLSNNFDFVDSAFFGLATSDQVNCNPCVQFTTVFTEDFFGHGPGWIANLFNSENNNAIYVATAIPEPGTLALLVGGIGAAWLRRRKTRS